MDGGQLGFGFCYSIPEIHCVIHRKGQEFSVSSLRPMYGQMKQHGTGHRKNCLKSPFSKILMMSADSREMKELLLVGAVRFLSNAGKGLIICDILFILDTKGRAERLKGMFRKNRFCSGV